MSKSSQKNASPKVIFRTVARNAEKTIARAIESVLAQTYANIELHLVNNGSTDSTGSIMDEYRKRDARVKVFTNEGNYVWKEGNRFTDYYKKYDITTDYMAVIDGDDEYKPDFLEIMIPFAEENDLDIAVCGYDIINAEKNEVTEVRKPEDTIILKGEAFGTQLPVYYRYMCMRWAKLYRLSLTDKLTISDDFDMLYGGDTVETTEYFRNAARVGMYPESYLKYYTHPGTVSYKWYDDRTRVNRVLHDTVTNYLIDKVGVVSPENKAFLMAIYQTGISATARVLCLSEIPAASKLEVLHEIFTCSHTRELADFPIKFREQRDALFAEIITWIVTNEELCSEECFDKIADIILVTKTLPETFPGWKEADIVEVLGRFQAKFEEVYGGL